jgi:hypothetical protein
MCLQQPANLMSPAPNKGHLKGKPSASGHFKTRVLGWCLVLREFPKSFNSFGSEDLSLDPQVPLPVRS